MTERQGTRPQTLLDVLNRQAIERHDQVVYTFLRDGEMESDNLTFGELRNRALSVAARLTVLNAPGDRAILLYPQGLEFIVALFGCMYAGVVAVPVSIPDRKRGFGILHRIAADAGAAWILSVETFLEQIADGVAEDSGLKYLTRLDPERRLESLGTSTSWTPPGIDPQEIALLQYTSGSTGSPRGVAITHSNLVDNHGQVEAAFGHSARTVFVSWLPMFHDMGLGTMLQAVWLGGRCILMSPRAFLQNPSRWLKAISTYRATSSGGPDFAYDLCARRIGEGDLRGLDLSSWQVAYNGSEPVRAATIDHFSEIFQRCGFRRDSFHPVYGLAEATLFASSEDPSSAPFIRYYSREGLEVGRGVPTNEPAGAPLVSCGRPWLGTEIKIVDPDTQEECADRRIGEIWLKGASVAARYWDKEAETLASLKATTATGQGPFLRTGDLGFFDDDHLYVTGRLKDLIIVRGRNHYPQDIEDSVSTSHPALVAYGCAAFSVDSDRGEQLVIVQEVARSALRTLDTSAVVRAIRSVVSDHHALQTHAVVLLKPSTLPRTTSGKVRRKACRQAFLEGTLLSVASWTAPMMPASPNDADPDSDRREASARADRLIEWLRRHAADLVSSYASEDRRTISASLLRDFAKQGLIGMQVDSRYGGLGLGHSDTARVVEQLAAFDFALAMFVGLNNYLGIQPVAKYAPPEIKALLLPGLVHGEELAAFAFEEPGSPKAPSGLSVQAKPDGEERWRLFGTKYLDGGAQGPSVVSVFAHHEEPPGISAFVVSGRTDGLSQVRDGLSLGVLGFTRDSVVFDGVRVGRENLLGSLGSGLEIARESMMLTRLAIAAACVGGMKRCAQIVTRDGPNYGAINGKLTPNPVTLSRLGSVTARVAALECLVHRIAGAIDGNRAVPSEAFAACKILAPELLLRTIDDLMQLGGYGGYAETNRISSLYRDAGLLRNFDGSPEAVAELTGAVVMEEDASLRLLIEDVFGAPHVVRWIEPVLAAVRLRMTRLSGALARRAHRWGHTRAGELSAWLALLAAVEGAWRSSPTPELERARAWASAQFEYALASVRVGTPSETATLDTSDVAATFASYASTIGELNPNSGSLDSGLSELEAWQVLRPEPASVSTSGAVANQVGESSKRELRSWILSWLASRLQIPVSQIELGRSFADHGLDSVAAVELAKALSDELRRELDATLLWDFATIDALVDYLVQSTQSDDAHPSPMLESTKARRGGAQGVVSDLDDEIARLERELKSRK